MDRESAVAGILSTLGVSALSRSLGHRNASTVSSWKSRGSIPAEHWKQIVEFARDRGVTLSYEELAEAHAKVSSADEDRAAS